MIGIPQSLCNVDNQARGPIKSVRILKSECKDMADDKYKRDCPDRDRINVHEEYTLGYWTKTLA